VKRLKENCKRDTAFCYIESNAACARYVAATGYALQSLG
jgi:hypothetical protein